MSILLQVKNIKKSYGPHTVLNGASFSVSEKQRIGVIGRNGAGKSTMFRIIMGQEKYDEGEVITYEKTRIGYIEQIDNFREDDTALSYLLHESGKEEWHCAKVAAQFEIKKDKLQASVEELSGGFRMRLKLAATLLKDPNILLLDEPTNYLDLRTMMLLENFLQNFNGAVLLISHDRRFIKNVCKEIIDIENGKAYHFPGELEGYLVFKEEKLLETKKYNKKMLKKKKHLQSFIDRFGAKASKASQAKSKEKQIKKLKTIDIENIIATTSINIPEADPRKGRAFRLIDVSIGYPNKTVATEIDLEIERGEHIALLGDNGEGKSTFLKNLAGELEPIEGELKVAKNLRIAYFAQHVINDLNPKLTVEKYLEERVGGNVHVEEIYKMAGDFLFSGSDIKKPISVLSGGEKARLCLAGIFLRPHEVLLLDEPTNHLDFETSEALALALAECNATVIFISHDRTFTSIIADRIFELRDGRAKKLFGDYGEYLEALEERIQGKTRKKTAEASKLKANRRHEYEEKKQARNSLLKIERKLEKLEQEKQKILNYFENNPLDPAPEKSSRLLELEKEVIEAEKEWMLHADVV